MSDINVGEELQSVLAGLDAALAAPAEELEALVLAWPNGLAVRFHEGKPCAVGAVHAEVIVKDSDAMPEEAWAFIPQVSNGHGEKAALIKFGELLAKERANVAALIELLAEKQA